MPPNNCKQHVTQNWRHSCPQQAHEYMQDSNNDIVKRNNVKMHEIKNLFEVIASWSSHFTIYLLHHLQGAHILKLRSYSLHPTQRGCEIHNATMTTTIHVQMPNFLEQTPTC